MQILTSITLYNHMNINNDTTKSKNHEGNITQQNHQTHKRHKISSGNPSRRKTTLVFVVLL